MKQYIWIFTLLLCTLSAMSQVEENSYMVQNVGTGKVMRIKDTNSKNGTPIVAYSPVEWKCVTWDFRKLANGNYHLVNLFSGKTMQPATDGKAMEEQPLDKNSETQQFQVVKTSRNQYEIKLKGSDLYLTAPDENTGFDQITLAPRNGTDLQRWTFKEQHPKL